MTPTPGRTKRVLAITWAQTSGQAWWGIQGLALLLLALFYLFARESAETFLLLSYVIIPSFLLPVAATMVARDRESGLLGLIIASPTRGTQYLLGNLLAAVLLALTYVCLTLPFVVVLSSFAGPAYYTLLVPYAETSVFVLFVAIGYGLLVSMFAGRRTVAAIFAGFVLTLLLAYLPSLIGLFVVDQSGALGGKVVSAFLHLSPVVSAYDFLGTYAGIAVRGGGLWTLIPIVQTIVALGAAFFLFGRLQGAEDWPSSGYTKVVVGIVIGALLVAPGFAFQPSYSRELTNLSVNPELGVSVSLPMQLIALSQPAKLGTIVIVQVNATLIDYGNNAVTLHDLRFQLKSEVVSLNQVAWNLGDLSLLPSTGGSLRYLNITTQGTVIGSIGYAVGRAEVTGMLSSAEATASATATLSLELSEPPAWAWVALILVTTSPALAIVIRARRRAGYGDSD